MDASVKVLRQKGKSRDPVALRARARCAPDPQDLLLWYDSHGRVLPWRTANGLAPDPYRVWLSEIMLQQTTVAAVIPYFQRFIAKWPTIADLATAELDDVLKLWAGLGYYKRARLLHACARIIRDDYQDRFPNDEKTLRTLPGFGPYTSAAVAAIAFKARANVVDGNVERVMARVFCIDDPLPKAKAKLRSFAAALVPPARCGDYAQALMDLGATVCVPRTPRCEKCPWRNACLAKAKGTQQVLPRRIKPDNKPVRRAAAFVLFDSLGRVFLRRRSPDGLLAGMMEVPSTPWKEGRMLPSAQAIAHAPFKTNWQRAGVVNHTFTHFNLEIAVLTGSMGTSGKEGHWVRPKDLGGEALPSVMKKVLTCALSARAQTI